jgi:hypothetical protein
MKGVRFTVYGTWYVGMLASMVMILGLTPYTLYLAPLRKRCNDEYKA